MHHILLFMYLPSEVSYFNISVSVYSVEAVQSALTSIQEDAAIVDPWDPKNEYDSIENHQLLIEHRVIKEQPALKGNRIIDIHHILSSTLKTCIVENAHFLSYSHVMRKDMGYYQIYV